MRQSSYGIHAILILALFQACGDSESNDAKEAGAAAGTSAGMSSDGGANDSAGSPGSGGSSTGGDSDGASGDASSAAGNDNGPTAGAGGEVGQAGGGGTGGVEAPSCPSPDLSGDYDLTSASGDCETLNIDATELIEATAEECVMAIVSAEPDPGEKGVSGEITVALDGSFEEARLFLDDILRFPCSGTWDEQDETLSIVCEGVGDDCSMVLTRQ